MHSLLASNASQWLLQYGNYALFVLLAIGIFGLPIPDETLMVVAGYLMSQNKLPVFLTLVSAFAGSVAGISMSYILGRTAGHYLIEKYGERIGITQQKMQRAHNWFERWGQWTLIFGYFVPGVRHLTGYVAGATQLKYYRFALFAYVGAAIWVSTFISIGYYFGGQWQEIIATLDQDFWYVLLVIGLLAFFYYLSRRYRPKK